MTRSDVHRLVDTLPTPMLPLAARILEAIQETTDAVLATLQQAPVDDEPLTPEEVEALREAEADLDSGRVWSTEALRQDLQG